MPDDSPSAYHESQKTEAPASTLKIAWWSFKMLLKIQPVHTVVYLVSSITNDLRRLGYAYIFSLIIDVAVNEFQHGTRRLEALYPLLTLLFVYNLLFQIISFFTRFSKVAINLSQSHRLYKLYLEKIKSLGISELEKPEVVNRMSRAEGASRQIVDIVDLSFSFVSSLAAVIATLGIVYSINPILIPLLCISQIPYLTTETKYRKLVWDQSIAHTENARRANNLSGALSSSKQLEEISVTGSFNYLISKATDFYEWFFRESLKVNRNWYINRRVWGVLPDAVTFSGYILIFSNFLLGKITVGQIAFQIRSIEMFQDYMASSVELLGSIRASVQRIYDIYYIFNLAPVAPDGFKEMKLLTQGPVIDFKKISFTYPGSAKEVVRNLNFKVNKNEKIAIVGHNGAGKTTLIKLLCRFYRVSGGEMLINGENINDLKIDSLYQNMGVLFQEFNGYPSLSAAENIAIGKPEVPMDRTHVEAAAVSADAYDFIQQYPNKFDQILSERFKGGIRPSSGQWQKIAIARFFYRNSPLLIFDEPTAAIDAISEYNIFNKIYDFFKGKTVIIVSHRFSTVRNADRILVLEEGELIEQGTHDELMRKDGYYAKAFRLQAEGYTS